MKKNHYVDFEVKFGSQDPALQPTAEDFAAISCYIEEQKQLRAVTVATKPAHPRRKTAA